MQRVVDVREPTVRISVGESRPRRHGPVWAREAGVLGLVVLVLVAAGCGSTDPKGRRALAAFFTRTTLGGTLGKRFPHDPGSVPCTVFDHKLEERVKATCATDVAVEPARIIVTFTESWSHGTRTHTWFVFLRRDGTVKSVKQEGAAMAG